MKKPTVFTTFSPNDDVRARRKIMEISTLHPQYFFIGRHILPVNASSSAVQTEINRSNITLALVGKDTLSCSRVINDLRLSQAKSPANAVIYITLDGEIKAMSGSPVGSELESCGAEEVASDLTGLDDCLERARQVADLPAEIPALKRPSKCGRKC